jgi:hypothetical protein
LYDLNQLAPLLKERLDRIEGSKGTQCCCRAGCGVVLSGPSVITADVDQAFEACDAKRVGPAWAFYADAFRRSGEDHVMVHKAQRRTVSSGKKGFGGSTVCLSLEMLTKAIVGYAFASFALMGDTVWVMKGLPIGGLLSMAALSVVLGYGEHKWVNDKAAQAACGFDFPNVRSFICWLRYVDDVLAISHALCPQCLLVFVQAAYEVKLSPVSGVAECANAPHIWVDVELVVLADQTIALHPKNPNRNWLHGKEPQCRVTFLPWLGRPTQPFSILRGCLIGRLCRCRRLGLTVEWQIYRLIEDIVELNAAGYPIHFLRKLVHALPPSAVALALRKFIRIWDLKMRQMGKQGPYSSGSGAQPHLPLDPRRREPDRSNKKGQKQKKKLRRRSTSITSSSSSDTARKKRIAKAQRMLMKEDPSYVEWVDKKAKDEVKANATAQAEAFKEALAGAFETILTPAFPPHPPPTASGVPALPSPAAASAVVSSSEITKIKARLLESEFEHQFNITDYSIVAVTDLVHSHAKPPKNAPLIEKFLGRYGGGSMPRTHKDRTMAVISTLQGI